MKKYKIAYITCLLMTISYSAFAYNPGQLQQFWNTNKCPACDLSGAALDGGSSSKNHSGAILTKANLSNSDSDPMNLSQTDFSGANMTSIDLGESILSLSNFSNAIMKNAFLYADDFTKANFTGADLTGADLQFANLYGSNITSAQLATVSNYCGAMMPDGSTHQCN